MKENIKGIPLLFENSLCLVLDKPAGLPVQGGQGVKNSLDSILSKEISPRPLLVHRLDRDTSGIILVAKTREAAGFFSGLFGSGSRGKKGIEKRYLGLCSGIVEPEEGLIELEVEKKGSKTLYRRLSSGAVENIDFSLLELELITGRMHQIRRHLSQIGHPLLGDDKYGNFSLNRQLRKSLGLKHLLLHACRLTIPPSDQFPQGLDISAPPPDYWQALTLALTR